MAGIPITLILLTAPLKMLSAWIPFQDIDENKAPLVVLDGSHKWSDTEHLRCFNNQNLKEIEEKFTQKGRGIVEVPIILNKGQVSFHHCCTIHGSYSNCSNSVRLAFALYLQDYANRHQPFGITKNKFITFLTVSVANCPTAIQIIVIQQYFLSCGQQMIDKK